MSTGTQAKAPLLPSQHRAGIATACTGAYFVVLAIGAFVSSSLLSQYHEKILYEDASDATNVALKLPRSMAIGLGTSFTMCAIASFVFAYLALVGQTTGARFIRSYAIVLGVAFTIEFTANVLCWFLAFVGNMDGLQSACGVLEGDEVDKCSNALKAIRLVSIIMTSISLMLFIWSCMTYQALYHDLKKQTPWSSDGPNGEQQEKDNERKTLVEHSRGKHHRDEEEDDDDEGEDEDDDRHSRRGRSRRSRRRSSPKRHRHDHHRVHKSRHGHGHDHGHSHGHGHRRRHHSLPKGPNARRGSTSGSESESSSWSDSNSRRL